jgi:hypothetical protein
MHLAAPRAAAEAAEEVSVEVPGALRLVAEEGRAHDMMLPSSSCVGAAPRIPCACCKHATRVQAAARLLLALIFLSSVLLAVCRSMW